MDLSSALEPDREVDAHTLLANLLVELVGSGALTVEAAGRVVGVYDLEKVQ